MSEKLYCVYMHTNKINGKKYVGITCRDVNIRWNNGKGYIHNEHFYRAICKYGWDGFTHEILASGLSKLDACEMEIALIAEFHTQEADFGYNITAGGDHACHTEETKKKLSKMKQGRALTDEVKAKISASLMGRTAHWAGKNLSAEHKSKIGQSLMGHKHSEESKIKMSENSTHNMAVVCEDIVFGSIMDCSNYYKVSFSAVASWLRGDTNIPEKFVKMNLHYKDTLYRYNKTPSKIAKVFCDGNIYENISECARAHGVERATMSKWLRGINNPPQKFIDMNLHFIPTFVYRLETIQFN